jgi:hypothetical protein
MAPRGYIGEHRWVMPAGAERNSASKSFAKIATPDDRRILSSKFNCCHQPLTSSHLFGLPGDMSQIFELA